MKKILTHLTGIVFVITILVAGGCKQGTKDNAEATAGNEPKALAADSKDVDIFLKDTLWIDGRVHLEMYDSRDTHKKKVDSLETVVYRGSTVTWKKATNSNIQEVHDIRLIEADSIFSLSKDSIGLMSLFKLEILKDAKLDTIKYEIVFTVGDGGGTWCIDPYLRIED